MATFNNMLSKSKRKSVYDHLDLDDNYHAQKRYISERIAVELGVLKLEDSPQSRNSTEHFHSFNPFLKNLPINNYKTNMMTDFENVFTTKFSLDLNNNNTPDLMVSTSDESLTSEHQFESEMQDNPGKDEYVTPTAGSRVRSGYSRRISHSSSPSRESAYSFIENLLLKETGDSSISMLSPYHPGPYDDLPISYPSKALILYQPPEAVLMKSREMKDHDPFQSLKLKIKCILDNGSLVQEEHEKDDHQPRLFDTLMDDIVNPNISTSSVSPLW